MLVKLLLFPIFELLKFLIGLIPDLMITQQFDLSGLFEAVGYVFWFFPFSLFMMVIANVVFWLSVQGIWSIVEWIYKKIPGIS